MCKHCCPAAIAHSSRTYDRSASDLASLFLSYFASLPEELRHCVYLYGVFLRNPFTSPYWNAPFIPYSGSLRSEYFINVKDPIRRHNMPLIEKFMFDLPPGLSVFKYEETFPKNIMCSHVWDLVRAARVLIQLQCRRKRLVCHGDHSLNRLAGSAVAYFENRTNMYRKLDLVVCCHNLEAICPSRHIISREDVESVENQFRNENIKVQYTNLFEDVVFAEVLSVYYEYPPEMMDDYLREGIYPLALVVKPVNLGLFPASITSNSNFQETRKNRLNALFSGLVAAQYSHASLRLLWEMDVELKKIYLSDWTGTPSWPTRHVHHLRAFVDGLKVHNKNNVYTVPTLAQLVVFRIVCNPIIFLKYRNCK